MVGQEAAVAEVVMGHPSLIQQALVTLEGEEVEAKKLAVQSHHFLAEEVAEGVVEVVLK